jgi:hypothetical protein
MTVTGQRRVFDPARASHVVEEFTVDQHCSLCGELAAHAIVELLSVPDPPLTAYLCCEHFTWIMGDCADYPYEIPLQRSEGTT